MKDINAVADIPTIVKHTNSVLDLQPMLFRVAMGYLRNYERADDIVQATMIELYKYAGEPENIEAYAVAALKRNITRSYGRRDTNTVFLEDIPNHTDVIADTDDADNSAQLLHDILYKAMYMIPDTRREMLVMHVVDRITIKQIAQQMGCSVAKVKNDLATAKSELRQIMNKMKQQYE